MSADDGCSPLWFNESLKTGKVLAYGSKTPSPKEEAIAPYITEGVSQGQVYTGSIADVFLADDSKKRHEWKMAHVLNLFEGIEGKSRVALLLLCGKATLLCPLQRLVPLEVVQDRKDDLLSCEVSQKEAVMCTRARVIYKPDRF